MKCFYNKLNLLLNPDNSYPIIHLWERYALSVVWVWSLINVLSWSLQICMECQIKLNCILAAPNCRYLVCMDISDTKVSQGCWYDHKPQHVSIVFSCYWGVKYIYVFISFVRHHIWCILKYIHVIIHWYMLDTLEINTGYSPFSLIISIVPHFACQNI